ncbi:MAG: hypothetical protein ACYDAS_03935 [Patescibacteria group bacterium]
MNNQQNVYKYADVTAEANRGFGGELQIVPIAAIVVVVFLVVVGFFLNIGGVRSQNGSAYVPLQGSSGYQAVFLNNSTSSIYFGKIESISSQWIYLGNVFYLKLNSSSGNSGSSSNQSQYTLIHLSPSLSYGPMDQMRINTKDVLFTEDLAKTSKVYTSIVQYYKTHPSK